MDLMQLRLLVTIADSGGFSPAAKVLHLSQPTLSIQMRQLEQRLGVKLLERRGRNGTTLTPAGQVAYHHGKELLQRFDEMHMALAHMHPGIANDLAIAANAISHTFILPPVLREFRLQQPDVRLATTTGSFARILETLCRRQVELGIVWSPVPDSFAVHVLTQEPFVVTARWDHPLASRPLVLPADLAMVPFLLDPPGSNTRAYVESSLLAAGFRLGRPVSVQSPGGVKQGLMAGTGIGVVPRIAVERELASGRLCQLPVAGLDLHRELVLVHRADEDLSAPAEQFWGFLSRRLRGQATAAAAVS